MDSVVALHDKIDVSRQLIKKLYFVLKNVHGNVIDLHAANVSFSMILLTIDYLFNLNLNYFCQIIYKWSKCQKKKPETILYIYI